MKRLAILLLTALLAACASAPRPAPGVALAAASPSAPAAPADFLLTSAAGDFRAHPPMPIAFRNVRYGQLVAADGTVSHRLCGEFQALRPGGASEWVGFATIKTSGYEQWLGDHGAGYCGSRVKWTPGDLSAELQRRFDATK